MLSLSNQKIILQLFISGTLQIRTQNAHPITITYILLKITYWLCNILCRLLTITCWLLTSIYQLHTFTSNSFLAANCYMLAAYYYELVELQKDYFCRVSPFSTQKCPNHVFSKFGHYVRHKNKDRLVLCSFIVV